MKTIRFIQNVVAVIALSLALNLVDGLKVSFRDAFVAGVLVVLAVVMLLERALKEERRAE